MNINEHLSTQTFRNMNTILKWKKNIFCSTCKIYTNGKVVGKLKDKQFTQSAEGQLRSESFIFRTRGLFKQSTSIVNKKDNTVIGKISYNNWKTKATLNIGNRKSVWKYDNFWNTKWSIKDSEGIIVKYSGSATSGSINSNTEDPLFLLTGLYVTNYFRQTTVAVVVAALIPIWATLMN
jgi:hypothetical protein